ncbi:hypothetical protein EIKCOROL_02026 [Eikenella corrodens ATCC 23834]|uniref:Uncharacterized protein n=1 Tax=Eikenella corrodens ATCC 23834 TaxID=546274 RepID=C0DXC0_EIKCO|nr:hypothetical protein EIKCOROL_02026 [Eikenella corrodens ATCC 23834]
MHALIRKRLPENRRLKHAKPNHLFFKIKNHVGKIRVSAVANCKTTVWIK